MRDSILWSALRACFVTLFSMVGLCLGIIPVILLFSAFASKADSIPETKFATEVLPNAEGVRSTLSTTDPVILNINVVGVIGLNDLTHNSIREMLIESREGVFDKNRVKAVFVTIETPGGTVNDADGIYKALKSYKEQYKVPVYAYVDGMCASGGMYVAAAADKIYSSSVSLVGSVGVISPSFLNISPLLDKVGIQALTLYAGKGKDDLNPLRPWRPGEQESIQNIIDTYYTQFVDLIVTNRTQMDKQKLIKEYGANIYTADVAQAYGYIDGAGLSRNEALRLLLNEIGVQDDKYQVVELNRSNWFNTLFMSLRETPLLTGKIKHEFNLDHAFDPALSGKFLYLYRAAQ